MPTSSLPLAGTLAPAASLPGGAIPPRPSAHVGWVRRSTASGVTGDDGEHSRNGARAPHPKQVNDSLTGTRQPACCACGALGAHQPDGARWWSTLASPRSRSGSTARPWCWKPGSLHRAAGRLRVKVASVTVPGARFQAPHGLEAVAERTTDGDRETSQLPRISGGPLGEDEDRRVDLGLLPPSRVGRSGRLSDGGKLTRNGRCRSLSLVRCCPRSSIAACGVIGRRT